MEPSSDPLIHNEQENKGYQATDWRRSEGETGGREITGPTAASISSLRVLYSQAKEAKENSQGCCDFCLMFFGLLIGSLVWTLILVITLTIPIVMIILGATYIHDCPVEWMIPVFNIVAGSVLTVSNAMNMVIGFRRWPRREEVSKAANIIGWITTLLNIFLIGWFVAGCYWVFTVHGTVTTMKDPKTHLEPGNYCENTLYSFTFWLLNAVFIFFGTLMVASLVMACFILMCF